MCLSLTGTGKQTSVSTTSIQALVDSLDLSMPDDSPYPRVQGRESGECMVDEVIVKRTRVLRCAEQQDIALGLTEVLRLRNMRNPSKPGLFLAIVKNVGADGSIGHDPYDPRLWYEVDIRPVEQPSAFVLNTSLEYGDEADWRAHEVMSVEALQDLEEVAGMVVKRIDGVGYGNRGPRPTQEDLDGWEKSRVRRLEATGALVNSDW